MLKFSALEYSIFQRGNRVLITILVNWTDMKFMNMLKSQVGCIMDTVIKYRAEAALDKSTDLIWLIFLF